MIVNLKNEPVNHLTFLGSDYGGWGLDLSKISESSIIYSFGVGTDVTFDNELINKTKCIIHAFDPTPRSINWVKKQNLNTNFLFYEIGLSDKDGTSFFNEPPNESWVSYSETNNPNEKSVECQVKTLSSIMKQLNHSYIDLLKMDIEGSEFSVLINLHKSNIFPSQILVEFHGDDLKKITDVLDLFSNYNIYKRFAKSDYYLIKK